MRNGISERSYNDRKTSFYGIRYEEIERTSFNKIFWSKRKKKSKSQFGMLRKLIFLSLVSSLALYWFQWQPQGLLGNKLPAREMLIAFPFTLIHIICLTNKRAIFDTYRVIRFKNELRIWISIYLLVIFWLQSQFFLSGSFKFPLINGETKRNMTTVMKRVISSINNCKEVSRKLKLKRRVSNIESYLRAIYHSTWSRNSLVVFTQL